MQTLSVFYYPKTLELSSSLFPFSLTDVFDTSVLNTKMHKYGKLLSDTSCKECSIMLWKILKKYIKIELFFVKMRSV